MVASILQLTIEAIGFMVASIAFDVSYVYCVEIFPTNVRNFAVSFLRQSLMLGASLSLLLVVIGRLSPTISFIVFGALSIVSGIISLLLHETRNAFRLFSSSLESIQSCTIARQSSRWLASVPTG